MLQSKTAEAVYLGCRQNNARVTKLDKKLN